MYLLDVTVMGPCALCIWLHKDPDERATGNIPTLKIKKLRLNQFVKCIQGQTAARPRKRIFIGLTWDPKLTFHSFTVWTLFNFSVIDFFICKQISDTLKPTPQSLCKVQTTDIKFLSECLLACSRFYYNAFKIPPLAFLLCPILLYHHLLVWDFVNQKQFFANR